MSTIATAQEKIAQAFPFEVKSEQLYTADMVETPHYRLYRTDNKETIGNAVRQGYEPHTRDDVAALYEASEVAFQGMPCVARMAWRDGHYLTVGPTSGQRRSIIHSQDNIFPRLIVRAGYDGRAFSATLGYYRDLCSNLSMLQSVGEATVRLRHTSSLRVRMDDVVADFRKAAEGWEAIEQRAQEMAQRELSIRDFIAELYPLEDDATDRKRRSYERRVSTIIDRLLRERARLGGDTRNLQTGNGWELFNAVQGYVQHDVNRRGEPTRVERALIALNDAKVRQAESLVFSLSA